MKKLVSLTLALMIAVLALLPAMAEETYTVKSGVLSMLNVSEEEMANYRIARYLIGCQLEKEGVVTHAFRQIYEKGAEGGKSPNFEIVYFDTLDAALMALNAGTIDECSLPRFVAEYIVKVNPGSEI